MPAKRLHFYVAKGGNCTDQIVVFTNVKSGKSFVLCIKDQDPLIHLTHFFLKKFKKSVDLVINRRIIFINN